MREISCTIRATARIAISAAPSTYGAVSLWRWAWAPAAARLDVHEPNVRIALAAPSHVRRSRTCDRSGVARRATSTTHDELADEEQDEHDDQHAAQDPRRRGGRRGR